MFGEDLWLWQREYKEVSVNTLESFRSTPIFSGKRMYLRGVKNLYCIGEE